MRQHILETVEHGRALAAMLAFGLANVGICVRLTDDIALRPAVSSYTVSTVNCLIGVSFPIITVDSPPAWQRG